MNLISVYETLDGLKKQLMFEFIMNNDLNETNVNSNKNDVRSVVERKIIFECFEMQIDLMSSVQCNVKLLSLSYFNSKQAIQFTTGEVNLNLLNKNEIQCRIGFGGKKQNNTSVKQIKNDDDNDSFRNKLNGYKLKDFMFQDGKSKLSEQDEDDFIYCCGEIAKKSFDFFLENKIEIIYVARLNDDAVETNRFDLIFFF